MMLRRLLVTFACLCSVALAGCGFHPRAELAIPDGLGPVRVVAGDPYSPLGQQLSRALTRAHAQPADPANLSDKAAVLRIVGESWEEAPLSIDSHAHAHEYYVTYVVKFSFTAADGKDIEPVQEARLQRNYEFDIDHSLGSSQESATIHEEMQRDMAATIMRRIGIALRHFKQ